MTGKQLLNQRGDLIYRLLDTRAMSDHDFSRLMAAAGKCTATNCGWGTYEAAKLLLENREFLEDGRSKRKAKVKHEHYR